MTDVQRVVLDRASKTALSNWRVTGWHRRSNAPKWEDPSFGRFETQTEKGLVIRVKAVRQRVTVEEFVERDRTHYELCAVTPNHSQVSVYESVYEGDRGGSELQVLYDRLYAHFLPTEQARLRQLAEQEAEYWQEQQREKEDDILGRL